MSRRLGAGSARTLDWRIVAIGGILVLGLVILLLVFLFSSGGGDPSIVGFRQVDAGRVHIEEGTQGTGYTSVPATSGQHWNSASSPGPWGVYTSAQPQERLIHNMEHGGIVIWYQPAQLSAEEVATLTQFVQQQITTEKFKVILSPWSGADFGHPIALTAWDWLLDMDTVNLDTIRGFIDAHINRAPESAAGPPKPG